MEHHVTCIYSSGGGNTRLVVDTIAEVFSEHTIDLSLVNAITATAEDMLSTQIVLLAAPTYDHGVLHQPYEQYIDCIDDIDLTHQLIVVIGLGDDKYDAEYNVESIPLLEDFAVKHHATIFSQALRIHKSPIGQIDTIRHRAKDLADKIIEHDQAL